MPGSYHAGPASISNSSVTKSMEQVVEEVANMGFTRDQVRGVIRGITESGQSVVGWCRLHVLEPVFKPPGFCDVRWNMLNRFQTLLSMSSCATTARTSTWC